MNLTATQIEDIVRVVVERLRTDGAAQPVPTATPNTATTEFVATKIAEPAPGEVLLSERVITLESLKSRLNGVTSVVVHPKAVVTPAVRDLLRQHSIRLVKQVPLASVASVRPAPLLMVTHQSHFATLSKQVCSQQATTIEASSTSGALSQITDGLTNSKLGAVWCTDAPFASLAATFGNLQLRAVQLSQLQELPTALSQAQPNVIIVDCAKWKSPAIVKLVNDWFRSIC